MNLTFILHFDSSHLPDRALAQSQMDGIHAYCKAQQIDLLTRDSFYHDKSWVWEDQTLQLAYDLMWNPEFKTNKTEAMEGVALMGLSMDPEAITRVVNSVTAKGEMADWTMIPISIEGRQGDALVIRKSNAAKVAVEQLLARAVTPDPMIGLKRYCDSIGLIPRTLVEVGAAHPKTYRLGEYAGTDSKVILVEANPRLHHCLKHGYDDGDFRETWSPVSPADMLNLSHQHPGLGDYPNVTIHHAAIVDVAGETVLFECNASSYVGGIDSPARVNDAFKENAKDARVVPGITIDQIDDGTIDVLLADCEGSEWFCLKHLKSRPKLIVLEMSGQGYVNPYAGEILEWLTVEGYSVGGHGLTDSWFIKKGAA